MVESIIRGTIIPIIEKTFYNGERSISRISYDIEGKSVNLKLGKIICNNNECINKVTNTSGSLQYFLNLFNNIIIDKIYKIKNKHYIIDNLNYIIDKDKTLIVNFKFLNIIYISYIDLISDGVLNILAYLKYKDLINFIKIINIDDNIFWINALRVKYPENIYNTIMKVYNDLDYPGKITLKQVYLYLSYISLNELKKLFDNREFQFINDFKVSEVGVLQPLFIAILLLKIYPYYYKISIKEVDDTIPLVWLFNGLHNSRPIYKKFLATGILDPYVYESYTDSMRFNRKIILPSMVKELITNSNFSISSNDMYLVGKIRSEYPELENINIKIN